MKCTIKWLEGELECSVAEEEGALWEKVGRTLLDMAVPNMVEIDTPRGSARLKVIKRGSYIKDGEEKPSMYVTPEYNGISLPSELYEERYLTCINPESNNYKFYHLKPSLRGIDVTYGRIGSERGEAFGVKDISVPYDTYLYWIRYYEKLSKGYVDRTDAYLTEDTEDDHVVEVEGNDVEYTASAELYKLLYGFAKGYVKSMCRSTKIKASQLAEAKDKFLKVSVIANNSESDLEQFNNGLLELMSVSPRKCRNVDILLASKESEIPDILTREENLIMAMEALVSSKRKGNEPMKDAFLKSGIEVYEATAEQRNKVVSHLSKSLTGRVNKVYRVINQKHRRRFNAYLKKNEINKVCELWHGSRNENWLSIIEKGLMLNPDAVTTGKAFGQGIYFAEKSNKSWNYTSYYGSCYASGKSDTGIMGVYVTAYGNPLDVSIIKKYSEDYLRVRGYDCVHAHAGVDLLNDEIIFYNEAAVLLNYIVTFK